ncbi:MAG: hypothetical protein ACTHN0_06835 [Aquihabitans sp.]
MTTAGGVYISPKGNPAPAPAPVVVVCDERLAIGYEDELTCARVTGHGGLHLDKYAGIWWGKATDEQMAAVGVRPLGAAT